MLRAIPGPVLGPGGQAHLRRPRLRLRREAEEDGVPGGALRGVGGGPAAVRPKMRGGGLFEGPSPGRRGEPGLRSRRHFFKMRQRPLPGLQYRLSGRDRGAQPALAGHRQRDEPGLRSQRLRLDGEDRRFRRGCVLRRRRVLLFQDGGRAAAVRRHGPSLPRRGIGLRRLQPTGGQAHAQNLA